MEKENFHDGFENLFREKLENIEYPYSSSGWSGLKKGLRKQGLSKGSFFSSGIIASVIVSSVAIIAAGIYFFNYNEDTISEKNIIANTETTLTTESRNDLQIKIDQNSTSEKSVSVNEANNAIKTNHSEINSKAIVETKNCKQEITAIESSVENLKNISANESVSAKKVAPDARFTFDVVEGCSPLKVKFIPNVKCDSMIYLWSFGDGGKSTEASPTYIYNQSGKYNASLTTKFYRTGAISTEVSNVAIIVKPSAIADLSSDDMKQNKVAFRNMSSNFDKIEWSFGDNESSILDVVEHMYKVDGTYNLKLIAYNNSGCNDTLLKKMQINIEHEYIMPTAFKPNGDNKNETFGPVGEDLDSYQYEMYIYNRFNNLIFETKDVNVPWDGKIKGTNQMADVGVYVWIIITKDKNGNVKKRNGNVTLLNN